MRDALSEAETAVGRCEPNPRVGCVIGLEDGRVLGRGSTQVVGGPHAEVMALRDAQAAGYDVRGATAWVTLEPCAHHGRTPPCCDSLIASGIRRVVIGIPDPFPQVNGRGAERLRMAGIDVAFAARAEAQACRELNIGFLSRFERGRPWVRLKVAVSLDGRTATPDGRSQWITGPSARADGHEWRRRASMVLTGVGTVISDDPRLDARLASRPASPIRGVLDSQWRTPTEARLLRAPGEAWVMGCAPATAEAVARACALDAAGIRRVEIGSAADGRPDPASLLQALARLGINEVHVEAGATLNGAFLSGHWVDELVVYVAPRLIGEGRALASGLEAVDPLAGMAAWKLHDLLQLDDDVRLTLRPRGASGLSTGLTAPRAEGMEPEPPSLENP